MLLALIYYHMFRFPMKLEEIRALCQAPVGDPDELRLALERLVDEGIVEHHDGFWFLGDPDQIAERAAGAERERRMRPRAEARARLIAAFPFARGVCLSGTISKGVLGERDDVDFFVITAPGRVWLCRTLLMVFKRLFLAGSHRLFCVNYLVAEDRLALPDMNLFTATELAWLVPVVGRERYDELVAANGWLRSYLPNWSTAASGSESPAPAGLAKRAIEAALEGRGGDRLDALCRRAIDRRNRSRYRTLAPEVFGQAMRATPTASKHHPLDFQGRILARFEEAVHAFEQELGIEVCPTREMRAAEAV